jgi:hypothetical protein
MAQERPRLLAGIGLDPCLNYGRHGRRICMKGSLYSKPTRGLDYFRQLGGIQLWCNQFRQWRMAFASPVPVGMTYSNRMLHPMWHRCYPPDYKPARHRSTVNHCCLPGTARNTPYDCSTMRSRVSAVATARGNELAEDLRGCST